jgi:uncharacterized protein YodC (DUF2158 family)
MHEPPKFLSGDYVRDREGYEVGRVETVRSDGMVNVRWNSSGRTEWVSVDEIEYAPGFKPKRRPRS